MAIRINGKLATLEEAQTYVSALAHGVASSMEIDAGPPPMPECFAGCGRTINPDIAVHIHIADNPAEGPVTINMLCSGAHFCAAECRAAWWETATDEALCPPFTPRGPISATVFYVDPETTRQMVRITSDAGQTLLDQKGAVVSHHRFETADDLERWWRCEAEAEALALPMRVGAT